jgi:phosphoadenosine phosphosulfate reductase
MKDAELLSGLYAVCNELAPVVLASSLSAEDMVLTDVIAREELPIGVFAIDTGRLHGDTLALIARIRERYGLEVEVYKPDEVAVERYVERNGRDAFYRDTELRQRCCEIRKVQPLRRALVGKRAWLTGQRRSQSSGRAALPLREHDAVHGLEKFNPLAAWSEDEIWDYIRRFNVPYNALYDHGYRSIGCAPCSRPVVAGEDVRAGRWWWEPGKKECGLHVAPRKELVDAS